MAVYIFWGTTVVIAVLGAMLVGLTGFFICKGTYFGFAELDADKRLLVRSLVLFKTLYSLIPALECDREH